MRAIILIGAGFTDAGPFVESLYVGLDGEACQKAADVAAKAGKYTQIGRINNPYVIPQPIVGHVTKGTKPSFVRPKAHEVKRGPQSPLQGMQDKSRRIREQQAAAAANITPLNDGKVLRTDGPTLEEYEKAGYKAANYPPQGYTEKQSPGLAKYKADKAAALDAAKNTPPAAPTASTGLSELEQAALDAAALADKPVDASKTPESPAPAPTPATLPTSAPKPAKASASQPPKRNS